MTELQEKEQKFREVLKKYLPDKALEYMVTLFMNHKVSLIITRQRKTKLGTFTHKKDTIPVITVNFNLNPMQFLVVLAHELAHFYTWEKNQEKRMQAHGQFWKNEYAAILAQLIKMNIFPDNIRYALIQYVHSNFASTKAKFDMEYVLSKYGTQEKGIIQLVELEDGKIFMYKGRLFQKIYSKKSRCVCVLLNDKLGRKFSFHLLAEVQNV